MKKNFIFQVILLILVVFGSKDSVAQEKYNFYFGNLHAHSAYSDGCKDHKTTSVMTPADCYQYAKNSDHMDFLGISDHNHSQAGMKLASYAKGLAQADRMNENGRFVCLYGMEYGVISSGGHVLIYGLNGLVGWESGNYDIFSAKSDYTSLFGIVSSRSGTVATLAHPARDDYNRLISQPYNSLADKAICGVAVSSGPAFSKKNDYGDRASLNYYSYYKRLLSLGYIVGPTMDHDNHYTTFGRMSPTRTAVLAKALDRASIIDAYRNNRFYATEDWNAEVDFTINNSHMGSYLYNAGKLEIAAMVHDPDPEDKVASIHLMYGVPGLGKEPVELKRSQGPSLTYLMQVQPGMALFFFLEITQEDGDRIYTSPIWVSGGPQHEIVANAEAANDTGIFSKINKTQPPSNGQEVELKQDLSKNIWWYVVALLGLLVTTAVIGLWRRHLFRELSGWPMYLWSLTFITAVTGSLIIEGKMPDLGWAAYLLWLISAAPAIFIGLLRSSRQGLPLYDSRSRGLWYGKTRWKKLCSIFNLYNLAVSQYIFINVVFLLFRFYLFGRVIIKGEDEAGSVLHIVRQEELIMVACSTMIYCLMRYVEIRSLRKAVGSNQSIVATSPIIVPPASQPNDIGPRWTDHDSFI